MPQGQRSLISLCCTLYQIYPFLTYYIKFLTARDHVILPWCLLVQIRQNKCSCDLNGILLCKNILIFCSGYLTTLGILDNVFAVHLMRGRVIHLLPLLFSISRKSEKFFDIKLESCLRGFHKSWITQFRVWRSRRRFRTGSSYPVPSFFLTWGRDTCYHLVLLLQFKEEETESLRVLTCSGSYRSMFTAGIWKYIFWLQIQCFMSISPVQILQLITRIFLFSVLYLIMLSSLVPFFFSVHHPYWNF